MSQWDDPDQHDVPRESELLEKKANRDFSHLSETERREVIEGWWKLPVDERRRILDEMEVDLL